MSQWEEVQGQLRWLALDTRLAHECVCGLTLDQKQKLQQARDLVAEVYEEWGGEL